jgi:hypothetical protein
MHSILEVLDEATDSAGPDLISLADLKLALGITDSADDATLQAAITFQSRIIAEYCDRRFGRAEALETFTFDPGEFMLTRQALTLSLYPVAEILEISSAGATAADYQFDPASGRVWGGWSGTVAVVYSGGYDLPKEAPARLQKAVIEAVREGQTSGARDPSIREVQHGDTRTSYFTSSTSSASPGFLSAPVIDLIKPFRRLHVA